LEVDLLVLDQLLVFLVHLGDSMLHLSPKLIIELILKGTHFKFDTCQVYYVLKLLEKGLLCFFKQLGLDELPVAAVEPFSLNDLF
jgi:hypothetical protein